MGARLAHRARGGARLHALRTRTLALGVPRMNEQARERKPPVQWHATLSNPGKRWDPFVLGASITEELGRPYRIELELRLDEAVDVAQLLGAQLELSWQRADRQRTLRAVVLEVELLGGSDDAIELEIVAG